VEDIINDIQQEDKSKDEDEEPVQLPVDEPDISPGAALRAILDVESFYLKHLPGERESHAMLQKLRRELRDIYSKTYKLSDIRHFFKS
jgi:hypothetical protein